MRTPALLLLALAAPGFAASPAPATDAPPADAAAEPPAWDVIAAHGLTPEVHLDLKQGTWMSVTAHGDRVLFDLYVEGRPNRAMRQVDDRSERQITRLRGRFADLLKECHARLDR